VREPDLPEIEMVFGTGRLDSWGAEPWEFNTIDLRPWEGLVVWFGWEGGGPGWLEMRDDFLGANKSSAWLPIVSFDANLWLEPEPPRNVWIPASAPSVVFRLAPLGTTSYPISGWMMFRPTLRHFGPAPIAIPASFPWPLATLSENVAASAEVTVDFWHVGPVRLTASTDASSSPFMSLALTSPIGDVGTYETTAQWVASPDAPLSVSSWCTGITRLTARNRSSLSAELQARVVATSPGELTA
jgi:hypothetical protein